MRRRYKDALLKIQSSLNNPNTNSVLEVKKNVYLLLSDSSRGHDDSKSLIKQYYQQAITEHGEEELFKDCLISQEKPINAVLASPGVHYEKEYLEDWNKQRHCQNPLTREPGSTHFVKDDVYNKLYKQQASAVRIQRLICKWLLKSKNCKKIEFYY